MTRSTSEDAMFSPFLRKPFNRAREEGLIPENLDTIAGTWGAIYDTGDLANRELLRRGYSEDDIEKICSGNILRVWAEVERVAQN